METHGDDGIVGLYRLAIPDGVGEPPVSGEVVCMPDVSIHPRGA